ncbi:hypothetical protein LUZ60_007834 [Juncus effusus]|nr:hypothetical protein LUZ60_007834 [Juncus effusus]
MAPTMLLSIPHLLRTSSAHSLNPSHSLLRRSHSNLHPDSTAKDQQQEQLSPASAAALAASIRRSSPSSPVEFSTERTGSLDSGGPPMPSSDFQRLCVEQLQLFRMVVRSDAILSVYVRPAGSYIMNQLELRRVAILPGIDSSEKSEYVILIGNFSVVAGLKLAESALSKQEMDFVPEFGAIVIPLVKHPFIVGFLVAELPNLERETNKTKYKSNDLKLNSDDKNWGIQTFKEDLMKNWGIDFSNEQKSRAVMICRSLATAYVMDQKALLAQQTSWQNNVRMSQLVEQIRGPLSSIKALARMLSMYVKRNEVPYDIIEDIIIQGDHMKDALQQIQDAVYLTKANIVRMNGHTNGSSNFLPDLSSKIPEMNSGFKPDLSFENPEMDSGFKPESNSLLPVPESGKKDSELPMPPLWLVPLQQNNARPSNISDLLQDLVSAAIPLASKQNRTLELQSNSKALVVAVEESALRQAFSNLIEGALLRSREGGRVVVYVGAAPAGGALVVVDDDGPDMQYMTQMHALTPFGAELLTDGTAEDNMAWNFIAGLTVAREILESFGCVVRVVSPRKIDAGFGYGGTRVELWLPSLKSENDRDGSNGDDARSA